jgi:hypothetical protein
MAVCLSVDDACGSDGPELDVDGSTPPSSVEANKTNPGTSQIRGTVDPAHQ